MPILNLTPAERQGLLDYDRRSADHEVRLRAHILLLLAAAHPLETVSAVLFCSSGTISRWKQRFEVEVGRFPERGRRPRASSPAWCPKPATGTRRLAGLLPTIYHTGNRVRLAQPVSPSTE
jgi:hypothetical protein